MSEIINYGVLPNSQIVLIEDHGRHLPNGIATLDADKKLVEQLSSEYACDYPSPTPNKNLMQYAYDIVTGGQ